LQYLFFKDKKNLAKNELICYNFVFNLFYGIVAQWLEQGAHNALVAGSSPANPTIWQNQGSVIRDFLKRQQKEKSPNSLL